MRNLSDDEARQLLQKKLKYKNRDYGKLISGIEWSSLAIELASASFNKGLKPMSEFIKSIESSPKTASAKASSSLVDSLSHKSIDSSPETDFAKAFSSIFDSLSPFQQHLLYFVSSFRPPEIPELWIRSFIEWRNDDEELYELATALRSLTELSLLTYVSGTNEYKMQAEIQTFIAG